ncbi:MAG: hypothetical protein AB1442_17125 [Nitrospirota bacterium]
MKKIRALPGIPAMLIFALLSILPAEGGSRNTCSQLSPQEFTVKWN